MKVLTSSGTSYTVKHESGHYFILDTDDYRRELIQYQECSRPIIGQSLMMGIKVNREVILSNRVTSIE